MVDVQRKGGGDKWACMHLWIAHEALIRRASVAFMEDRSMPRVRSGRGVRSSSHLLLKPGSCWQSVDDDEHTGVD